MPSALDHRTERFEERDSFHRALLGLRVILDRFAALMEKFAEPRCADAAPLDPRSSGDTPAELDDPLLVALGALALGEVLASRLDTLAEAKPAVERRASPKAGPLTPSDLLR